jgi:hypothetical protein
MQLSTAQLRTRPQRKTHDFFDFFEISGGFDPYLACEKSKSPLQRYSSPFAGDSTIRFDDKTGKFQIVSKKEVPSRE